MVATRWNLPDQKQNTCAGIFQWCCPLTVIFEWVGNGAWEVQNTDGRLILTAEVTKNKIAKTSKIYLNNLFKYILLVLAILFFLIYYFVTSAARISLPSVFCILDNLLIKVYKRYPAPLIGLSLWYCKF